MSKSLTWLIRACRELCLKVEIEPEIQLRPNQTIVVQARLPELGAINGMLIFDSFEDIRGLSNDLLDAGYGYSILSEPPPHEEFDLTSHCEMFSDWGWQGDPHLRPAWFTDNFDE